MYRSFLANSRGSDGMTGSMDQYSADIMKKLQSVILKYQSAIKVAGVFGSKEEDLDILVVYKQPDWNTFQRLCESISSELPQTKIFPTFRLQQFVDNKRSDELFIHLLFFPSPKVLQDIERPFVRYCIAQSFVSWIGDNNMIYDANEPTPKPDLSYYLNLLFETAQVYLLGAFPRQIALNEIQKKLIYILKFSLLECFYTRDKTIDLKNIEKTIFSNLNNPIRVRAYNSYKRITCWNQPSRNEVINCIDEALSILKEFEHVCS